MSVTPTRLPNFQKRHEPLQAASVIPHQHLALFHEGMKWFALFGLSALAVFVLIQIFDWLKISNWWAMVLTLPAVAAFVDAHKAFNMSHKEFTSQVCGAVLGGLLLIGVTIALLLNLDWHLFLPLVVLLGGAALLLTVLPRPSSLE